MKWKHRKKIRIIFRKEAVCIRESSIVNCCRRVVSQELIELLKYMEHSTDEVSEQCKSERIQKMHRRVCRIKASEKTEVKYMQAWEENSWKDKKKKENCSEK